MKKIFAAALFALCLAPTAYAAQPTVLDLKETITDNSIVYPETFERDTRKLLEGWYLKNYTTTDDRYASRKDVEVKDDELKRRLAAMPTVIEMPFNQIVKDYIKRYTSKSRAQVAAILGLGLYYTPIFEQALEQAGLPLELKYLPVIESGLDPNAVSKHGATGLWQLMLGTGKGLGLEVNSIVDERRDPYLSSEKAVSYLKDLYDTYGDWSLAIAAYNCGPNNVNKALRRAGGDPKTHDFWSIYNYLSPETRGYVPMFIAANYVMTYHNEHNISPVLATKPLITDTVAVYDRLHFNQISEVLNVPVDELRILNPQFRADIIPASEQRPYFLILPAQQIQAFLVSHDAIKAHDAEKYAQRLEVEPGDAPAVAYEPASSDDRQDADLTPVARNTDKSAVASATSRKSVTHKVAAGETLGSIAANYGTTASEIKEWNSLRRNAVRAGQQLVIYVPDNTPAPTAQTQQNKPSKKAEPAPAAEPAKPAKKQEAKPAQPAQPAKTEPAPAKTTKKNTGKQQDTNTAGKGKKTDASKKNAKAKKQTPPKPKDVEVVSGDNLTKIAKRNGVTVDELRKANPKLKGDMLRPGDKLVVPPSQKAANDKNQAPAPKKGKKKGKK